MSIAAVSPKSVGIFVDTESTGLGTNTIIHDFAFIAFDLDDPDTIIRDVNEHFPLAPQQAMGRVIETGWLLNFILKQPSEVQKRLELCGGDDMEELLALVRSVIRKFNQAIEGAEYYEIWIRRPQHDIPLIASLFRDCGESVPWKYDTINDVASIMNAAGITVDDVDSSGCTKHTARGDCIFGIRSYVEAMRRLRSAV